jgi:hypothetical protein
MADFDTDNPDILDLLSDLGTNKVAALNSVIGNSLVYQGLKAFLEDATVMAAIVAGVPPPE